MDVSRVVVFGLLLAASGCAVYAVQRDSVAPAETGVAVSRTRTWTEIPGQVVSMCPLGAAGVAVLTADEHVTLVSNGAPRTIALPKFPDNVGDPFCSLAARGNELAFCRYQDPRVFVLDVDAPQQWRIIVPQGLPDKNPGFVAIRRASGNGWLLRDGESRVFHLDAAGKASIQPTGSAEGTFHKMPSVRVECKIGGEDGVKAWRIRDDKGNTLYSLSDGKPERNCVGLEVLGEHPRGQLVLLTTTRNRDRSDIYEVRVVDGQKTVTTVSIPSAANCFGVRNHVLLDNGAVCFVRPTPSGKGSTLHLISL